MASATVQPVDEKKMTINELAAREKVSKWCVQKWISHGVRGVYLNARSKGGRLEIAPADYEAFNREIDARRRSRFQPEPEE